MKRLALLTVLALVPASMALAQTSLDDEINQELDRMYQQKSSRTQTPSIQVNVQTNPTSSANPYNNQVSGQSTTSGQSSTQEQKTATSVAPVQKAAVTVIESSPLDDSMADKLRKARQDAELKTEESMVMRLEKSRLDDERRRAEALFGDRFHQIMEQKNEQASEQKTQSVIINQNNGKQGDISQLPTPIQAPAQAPQQIPAPPTYSEQPVIVPVPAQQTVQPAPVIVVRPDDTDREERRRMREREEDQAISERERMRSDVRTQLSAEKQAGEEVNENKTYIAGLLGMTEYQDVSNVRGNYSLGVALGTKVADRLIVEGDFRYAAFDIEQPDSGPYGYDPVYGRITKMTQYSGSGTVKYQLLNGMIKPVVGGVAGYTYRTFEDTQLAFPNNDASSHAIDLGVMAGADIEVTKTFSIGADFRYMWNVYNKTNNSNFQTRFSQSVYNSGTPIEEISYMTFSLVGRASF